MDGHRLTVYRETWPKALGRKWHVDLWPELPVELRERLLNLPFGTVFDGELVAPSGKGSDVVTATRDGTVEFRPFAVPRYEGHDFTSIGFRERDRVIVDAGFSPPTQLVEIETDPERLSQMAVVHRLEGYVLKERHYRGWWKHKRTQTDDLVVVGWKPGKGKHAGRIGALEVARADGTVVGSVGKGRDELWRDEDPAQLMGRVCEVAHEGTPLRRLKFSSFVRWRDDKPKEECT